MEESRRVVLAGSSRQALQGARAIGPVHARVVDQDAGSRRVAAVGPA